MKLSILITGTNRGIGLALARIFTQYDWDVIACCRKPDEAEALKSIQAASEGRLKIKRLDVTRDEEITALAETLAEKNLDILLNNAGILGPEEQDFGFLDEDAWLETFKVNSIGPYKMVRAFLDNIARSQRRIIATITSQMGSIQNNSSGDYYAYRTSKSAANMIMKNLSLDLHAKRITCVALHPGWVKTRLGGKQAPLSPAESAAAIFKTLTSLSEEQNGSFLDYEGRNINW
jgi:NAD(P)-dependent dehydrogenase (short-subunit alcohol dehydrogenase family)